MRHGTDFYVTIAGVHRYSVRIPNRPIFDDRGFELDGLALQSQRLILISPSVQADVREEVLGHEVEHAWGFHVPAASNDEERAQLSATIMQALRMDFDLQGGIETLLRLQPVAVELPFVDSTARALTVEQLAQRWQVTGLVIRRLIASGKIDCMRLGRTMRIPLARIERMEAEPVTGFRAVV